MAVLHRFYCTLYLASNLENEHVVLFSDQSNFGRGIAAVGESFVCVGEYIASFMPSFPPTRSD